MSCQAEGENQQIKLNFYVSVILTTVVYVILCISTHQTISIKIEIIDFGASLKKVQARDISY